MAQAQEELAARQLPGTSECRELDVASFDSVRKFSARACAEAAERGGRKVKLLVNNAGASPCSTLPLVICMLPLSGTEGAITGLGLEHHYIHLML